MPIARTGLNEERIMKKSAKENLISMNEFSQAK